MGIETESGAYFSGICVERCGGLCCDPWWGIISYTMVKEGGLGNLRQEVIKGIRARQERIIEGYATNESPRRRLFRSPEKYNVSVRDIKVSGNTIAVNIMAMFAFRCLFLSEEKVCGIHPSSLGREIRPQHCGYMGSLNVKPGEKGYCRIIHAADNNGGVDEAIEVEKGASSRHYTEGVDTIDEAADRVVEKIKVFCEKNAPQLLPQEKRSEPGRNDPCWCGSGKKFKKCHG
jgi:Fe-S-cluster containining protein